MLYPFSRVNTFNILSKPVVVGGIRVVVNADVIDATLVVVVVGTENHNLFGTKRFYVDFCQVIIT